MSTSSLQEEINELKRMLHQKDEQIEQLRKDLNKVYQLCRYGEKSGNPKNLFIPEGENWETISSTDIRLKSSNPRIRVLASSTWDNAEALNPKWLFNGELQMPDKYGWASGARLPSYLEIHLDKQVVANFITITSRINCSESPTAFEVYGSNNGHDYIQLGEFSNITWQESQEQKFSFYNEVPFNLYQIKFLKVVNSPHPCVSFTKLNIGRIDINDASSQ